MPTASGFVGKDKVGRPIRLNDVRLEPGPKGYASIVFWGDIHWGHPACNIEKAKAMLDYCLANHIYIICMGDQIECGLKTSIGDSVYEQRMNPDMQTEYVIELLKPMAAAGLIIGVHKGN